MVCKHNFAQSYLKISHFVSFKISYSSAFSIFSWNRVEPFECKLCLLELNELSTSDPPQFGELGHVVQRLKDVRRVNNHLEGASWFASPKEVKEGWNYQAATQHVGSAVKVLIHVVTPGVAHPEPLQDFSEVHRGIRRIAREKMDNVEVQVVLEIDDATVWDCPHNMVK